MTRRKPGELFDSVLRVLEELGPMSSAEIAEQLGCRSWEGPSAAVQRLHKVHGKLHITRWQRRGNLSDGRMEAVYAMGPGRDKPKPKPLTTAETSRAYKVRRKEAGKRAASVFQLAERVGEQWRKDREKEARRRKIPPPEKLAA